VLTLFTLPLVRSLQKEPVQQLPVLGQINDFRLTNQEGREITSREFAGSVLLVNFIFTRCPNICPMMTSKMAKIQERLKGTAKSIQLLSISVDPSHDTPEVLKEYGKKFNADFKLWTFLTGPMEEIRRVVVDDFKTALDGEAGEPGDMSGLMEITHGEHFALVDQIGQVRGYRRIQNQEDIDAVIRDFAIIVNSFPQTIKKDGDS